MNAEMAHDFAKRAAAHFERIEGWPAWPQEARFLDGMFHAWFEVAETDGESFSASVYLGETSSNMAAQLQRAYRKWLREQRGEPEPRKRYRIVGAGPHEKEGWVLLHVAKAGERAEVLLTVELLLEIAEEVAANQGPSEN